MDKQKQAPDCVHCDLRDRCENYSEDSGFFCCLFRRKPLPERKPEEDPNARWLRGEDVDFS